MVGACATQTASDDGSCEGDCPVACVSRPALTEGPYFVDERLNRSDIRSDPSDGSVQAGVPLRLEINVFRPNGSTCDPLDGVNVDIWHANSQGVYSDVAENGTVGQKFLRGYQVTDAHGAVEFTTVYPGWYPGRTVHIHFKLRTFSGDQTTYEFTSQLFFDETVTGQVLSQSPYNARGPSDTPNAQDGVFDEQLLLTPVADGDGYIATFDIGIAAN